MCIYIYIYIYVYMYIHLYIYVYICIYTYKFFVLLLSMQDVAGGPTKHENFFQGTTKSQRNWEVSTTATKKMKEKPPRCTRLATFMQTHCVSRTGKSETSFMQVTHIFDDNGQPTRQPQKPKHLYEAFCDRFQHASVFSCLRPRRRPP